MSTASTLKPIVVTEWGFEPDAKQHWAGTAEDYGQPFAAFMDQRGYGKSRGEAGGVLRVQREGGLWIFVNSAEVVCFINGAETRRAVLSDGDHLKVGKLTAKFTPDNAKALLGVNFDRHELASRRLPYEELDQLLFDLMMGLR